MLRVSEQCTGWQRVLWAAAVAEKVFVGQKELELGSESSWDEAQNHGETIQPTLSAQVNWLWLAVT